MPGRWGIWVFWTIEFEFIEDMSLILCVETGTDVCSVGIAKDGELLSLRESDEGRDHARKVGVCGQSATVPDVITILPAYHAHPRPNVSWC